VFALMTLGEQRDEEGDRAGVYEVSPAQQTARGVTPMRWLKTSERFVCWPTAPLVHCYEGSPGGWKKVWASYVVVQQ
jgi:hypothetical protein